MATEMDVLIDYSLEICLVEAMDDMMANHLVCQWGDSKANGWDSSTDATLGRSNAEY